MLLRYKQKHAALSRTAKEAKKYSVITKVLKAALACIIMVLSIVYVVSILYSKFGSFTVTVNKFDGVNYGLTLCETEEFDAPMQRLNAKKVEDITNIHWDEISDDVDKINGSHNGDNYLAYTFYCKNVGEKEVTYEYNWYIANVVNNLDKAIRMELFVDGEPTVYARTRSDGKGAEDGTTEFASQRTVVKKQISKFKPGDITKFTAVIWIEGEDPDCTNDLLGGQLKSDMSIIVVK